jgi:hypothetical protein
VQRAWRLWHLRQDCAEEVTVAVAVTCYVWAGLRVLGRARVLGWAGTEVRQTAESETSDCPDNQSRIMGGAERWERVCGMRRSDRPFFPQARPRRNSGSLAPAVCTDTAQPTGINHRLLEQDSGNDLLAYAPAADPIRAKAGPPGHQDRCESLCKLVNSGRHGLKLPIALLIGACMPSESLKSNGAWLSIHCIGACMRHSSPHPQRHAPVASTADQPTLLFVAYPLHVHGIFVACPVLTSTTTSSRLKHHPFRCRIRRDMMG